MIAAHSTPILFIPVVIVVAITVRIIAGFMDRERIQRFIGERSGRVLEISWAPFGPGWFGARGTRIYAVAYADKEGMRHDVYCKTSMWSGVYFTDDKSSGQSL
jgi:hypothetical protein